MAETTDQSKMDNPLSIDIINGDTNTNTVVTSSINTAVMDDNVFDDNNRTESVGADSNALLDDCKPTETELLSLVQQQLEYYFSKDNISSDKYLLSQMDGDHFVPISILASFNQVKRLTADNDLLIKAIKDSNLLQIDMTLTKVRAIPEKRCILILREIPKETPKEDIQLLFKGETCPKFLSCEFAENDCWYVTFSGEEDAQEAHRYLREEVKHFNGNPIRARIKNMSAQRTSSVPKPRPQFPYTIPMQNLPFYGPQSPSVGWPFFDPRFAAQYPNGFPQHLTFTGTQNNSSSNITGRNYSVGSATDRRDNNNNNRDNIVRRGSAGSKRYDNNDRSGYSGNRYRREDERLRNLPNRLRNKRNEEIVQSYGGSSSSNNNNSSSNVDGNNENNIVKDDITKKDKTSKQQRYYNRPQPKLDLAPVNFPPLPTNNDNNTVAPPLPPPSGPTVTEDSNPNLADIVKGKPKGNGTNEGIKSPIVPVIPIPTTTTTPTDIKITSTVTVTTIATSPVITKKYNVDQSTTLTSNNNNSKDKHNYKFGHRDNKNLTSQSRGTQSNSKIGNNNGNRSRHKEYKKQTTTTTTTTNTSSSTATTTTKHKLLPNSTKRPITTTTGTDNNTTSTVPAPITIIKDEQDTDSVLLSPTTGKSEKLSYAQMAQQKPKPSPLKQSKPLNSPPSSSSNNDTPISPPSSPTNEEIVL